MTPAERRTYSLGRRSFDRGNVEDALEHLNRLLETRDGYADVHYMIGILHERRSDFGAATRSLRKALRLNPSYAEALLALANVYEQQGDFDRSQDIAHRAQEVALGTRGGLRGVLDATTRGKLANQQAELADAYRDAGDQREAIEGYRKALDRCPDFHDIRFRLAITLREAGLPDRALAEFRRILRARPDFPEAAVQLGLTLYTLGRGSEAERVWKEVAARHPNDREAPMYLRLVAASSESR